MKYKSVIDTSKFKHFKFFEDDNGKYLVGIDAGAESNDEWIPLYFTEIKEDNTTGVDISKLDLCPFCGSAVKMIKKPLYHGTHGYPGCYEFEVRCPECGCSIDYVDNDTIYRSEEEAIANVTKAWNKRK